MFEGEYLNKKDKRIKKRLSGLGKRIGSLVNFDTYEKPPGDTKQVSRLTVIAPEMYWLK